MMISFVLVVLAACLGKSIIRLLGTVQEIVETSVHRNGGKILLPAAQRWSGREPPSIAAKLRLDHGVLAALLIPILTIDIVATIHRILERHNLVEEGLDGLYGICDRLSGTDAEQLVTKLRATPEPAVLPHSGAPAVLGAVHPALEPAGYILGSDSP